MLVKDYPERFWIHQESQKNEVLHKTEHSKSELLSKFDILKQEIKVRSIQVVFVLYNFHESQKISNLWYEIKVRD